MSEYTSIQLFHSNAFKPIVTLSRSLSQCPDSISKVPSYCCFPARKGLYDDGTMSAIFDPWGVTCGRLKGEGVHSGGL
jgi:hypothetical protein